MSIRSMERVGPNYMNPQQNMQTPQKSSKGYGKRPLWQWIVLYVIVGGILYYLVYLFFFHHGSGGSAY